MNDGKQRSITVAALLAERAALQQAESTLRRRVDTLTRRLDDATLVAERYRHFFDTSEEPRFVADRMGTVREANTATCEMLAIAPVRLMGKPIAVFIAPEDRSTLRTSLAASGRCPARLVVEICGRGKQPRKVLLRGSPLPDGSGALWCVDDIDAADPSA